MAEGVNTKEQEGGPQGAEPLLAAAALLDEEKTASLSQEDGQYGKKGPGQGGAEMVSKMAEWRGPGCTRRVLGGIEAVCYRGVSLGGLTIGIGDFVYLQPAEKNMPRYIAQIQELMDVPGPMGAPSEDGGKGDLVKMAALGWYYRPEELEVDAPLPIFENEIFATDEVAVHPIESICGRCDVVVPQGLNEKRKGKDVFLCSRKYVPEEGRVVPLEGKEDLVNTNEREFVLVNRKIEPKNLKGPTTKSVREKKESSRPQRTTAKKRRKSDQEQYSPEASTPIKTKSGRSVKSTNIASVGYEEPKVLPSGSKGPPKSRYGRWTAERYDSAQASLVIILRELEANGPHKAILRPILREEARKVIGDTGLLDHLLKHLSDQVVSPEGEKLRRRHNREGHMEYWLQDPGSAVAEEQMLNEEMQALSAELREIREARNLLKTVRDEAADAIKVVKGSGGLSPEVTLQTQNGIPDNIQDSVTRLAGILDDIGKEVAAVQARVEQAELEAKKYRDAYTKVTEEVSALSNKFESDLQARDASIDKLKQEISSMKLLYKSSR